MRRLIFSISEQKIPQYNTSPPVCKGKTGSVRHFGADFDPSLAELGGGVAAFGGTRFGPNQVVIHSFCTRAETRTRAPLRTENLGHSTTGRAQAPGPLSSTCDLPAVYVCIRMHTQADFGFFQEYAYSASTALLGGGGGLNRSSPLYSGWVGGCRGGMWYSFAF